MKKIRKHESASKRPDARQNKYVFYDKMPEKGVNKYEFVVEILVEIGAVDREMDVTPLLLV